MARENSTVRVKLPHPELVSLANLARDHAVAERHVDVAGASICYTVFRPGPDTAGLHALYDELGEILVSHDLVAMDERIADLVAFHEHVEIAHKRAGRSHAYAHRRAYVEELVAARELLGPETLHDYLEWRVGGYPASKLPDPQAVIRQLAQLLRVDKVRKTALLQVITAHRL